MSVSCSGSDAVAFRLALPPSLTVYGPSTLASGGKSLMLSLMLSHELGSPSTQPCDPPGAAFGSTMSMYITLLNVAPNDTLPGASIVPEPLNRLNVPLDHGAPESWPTPA